MFEASKVAAASVVFAVAVSASAAPDTRPYFSLGGNIIFEDGDRESDTGYGVKLGIGKRMNNWLGYELGGFYNDFSGGAADWEDYGLFADANLYLNRSESFAPYLLVGAGVMRVEATANTPNAALQGLDQRRAFGAVGAGFKVYPDSSPVGLTADYRFRYFDTNVGGIEEIGDHIVSVGLLFPMGPKAVAAADTSMVDSDGDGVPDDRDLCPGTPAGVAVDERGCPLDSDGDGVPDYLDKCPDTAAGVVVNKDGCPVDAKGPNREFESVTFAFDRADLTDYARGILDAASKVIVDLSGSHAGLKVQIDGHTDAIGSPGYNVGLSERRANTVKQYLIRKGVDGKRIETRAFGLTKPVASNETEEGRAKNRRAEVRTLGQ
jgi:OmpA-OmpF porin, OOP family